MSGWDEARDTRNLELGRCVDCEGDKTDAELAAGRWRCQACRVKRAARAKRKRAGGDVFSGQIHRPRAGWRA